MAIIYLIAFRIVISLKNNNTTKTTSQLNIEVQVRKIKFSMCLNQKKKVTNKVYKEREWAMTMMQNNLKGVIFKKEIGDILIHNY